MLSKPLKKLAAFLALSAASVTPAMAAVTEEMKSDAFYSFWETVNGWTGGPLGIGLATTMLLMGASIGVAKNSPMPALTGIAGAAFLHWGPDIIQQIMVGGGLV